MKRFTVILLEMACVLGVGVSVLLLGVAYYIDTDEFRKDFVEVLEAVTGQPITLKGELNIALYPALSLEVLGLAVESGEEGNETPLLECHELQVSARLMPLLSRRVELKPVLVEGMTINVVRSKTGVINWQSILERQAATFHQSAVNESPSSDFKISGFSFAGLEVVNASVRFTDEKNGNSFTLSGVAVNTGSIVPDGRVPFTTKSLFTWGNGNIESQLIFRGVVETGGGKFLHLDNANVSATIGGQFLPQGAKPGELVADLNVDWESKRIAVNNLQIRFLGLRATGEAVSGNLSTDFFAKGHVRLQPFVPLDLIKKYFPSLPENRVNGLVAAQFSTDFFINEKGGRLSKVIASVDELKITGSMQIQDFATPKLLFDLHAGDIDLDRYLPLFETDTPFIWDDFSLATWQQFRGSGVVKAKSLTVLKQKISGLAVSVNAETEGISIVAKGAHRDINDILGKAQLRIGSNDGQPTLSGDMEVRGKLPSGGCPFMAQGPVRIRGAGRLYGKLAIGRTNCSDQGRSIALLRHLSGEGGIFFGKGVATFKNGAGERKIPYKTAECKLRFSPLPGEGYEYFSFQTQVDVQSQNTGRLESLVVSAKGPIITSVERIHVKSPGIQVNGDCSGTLYTETPETLSSRGVIVFDTDTNSVSVDKLSLASLETKLHGNVYLTDLNKKVKGKGTFSLPSVNVRRLVSLITKRQINTEDEKALEEAHLQADFDVDGNGFRLTGIKGGLDGMSVSGSVIGQELTNPKLLVNLTVGKLDVDRYLSPSREPPVEALRVGKPPKKAPPVELPLNFFTMLRLDGKVHFEELKIADIRAVDFSARIHADNGAIKISGGHGTIHGGDVTVNMTGTIGAKRLTTHLQMHVQDMRAGPLLKDLADREYVRGKTGVHFDLVSFGRTDDDIVANLNGKAWARIQDGSFKFTGYTPSGSPEPALERGSNAPRRDTVQRRTSFEKASAHFVINDGVFNMVEMQLDAPFALKTNGKGWFSLPDKTIDMSFQNNFVMVPSVTICLKGNLSDPNVTIPTGKIVNDTVRNILSLPAKSFKFLRDLF